MSRVELLLAQMDEVYGRLRWRLEGSAATGYLWEPVPGCWTVHRDESGAWVIDYAEPDPEPAPLTTIAWRLGAWPTARSCTTSGRSGSAA